MFFTCQLIRKRPPEAAITKHETQLPQPNDPRFRHGSAGIFDEEVARTQLRPRFPRSKGTAGISGGAPLSVVHWPLPVTLSTCGLPVSLSFTVMSATRAPFAAGLKVTVIVQVPPLAGTDEQLAPNWVVKSLASVPDMVAEVTATAAEGLLLVSVTGSADDVPTVTDPKASGEGDSVTYVPEPESVTEIGLAPPVSAIFRVAERLPTAEGVNVTVKLQVPPLAVRVTVSHALFSE